MGLVGESGCGKSTLVRTILQLIEPTSGTVEYDGDELTTMKKRELRNIRKHMQIVFQDPYSSLHPRMRVGELISEPLVISGTLQDRDARRKRVLELMEMVGLDPLLCGPLSPRIFRRPAAARCHCAGAGHEAAPSDL